MASVTHDGRIVSMTQPCFGCNSCRPASLPLWTRDVTAQVDFEGRVVEDTHKAEMAKVIQAANKHNKAASLLSRT